MSQLKGLKIAVIGCIMNGPGKMVGSDYGYAGDFSRKVSLYYWSELVKRNVPEEEIIDELIKLIKESGNWVDVNKLLES